MAEQMEQPPPSHFSLSGHKISISHIPVTYVFYKHDIEEKVVLFTIFWIVLD
jgi:hypothetical protein